jgi:hypothetical protein
LLNTFKTVSSGSIIDSTFTVHPRYNLICNLLTVEQENAIAENYRWFYDGTIAGKIHKHLQDGSTRQEFHALYRNRDDYRRKLPPFHNMFYNEHADEDSRPLAERVLERHVTCDEEPPAVIIDLDDDASSKSRVTRSFQSRWKLRKCSHRQKTCVHEDPDEGQAIHLSGQKSSQQNLQKELRITFTEGENVDSHKLRQAHWEGDLEKLWPIVDKCFTDTKSNAREIAKNRKMPEQEKHMPEREEGEFNSLLF